jgi:hypothetical protein
MASLQQMSSMKNSSEFKRLYNDIVKLVDKAEKYSWSSSVTEYYADQKQVVLKLKAEYDTEEENAKEEEKQRQIRKAVEEAERAQAEAEEEANEANRDREVIEAMLDQAHSDAEKKERAARSALRLEREKRRDLKRKMKQNRVTQTNGVIIAVRADDDIDTFFDYVHTDRGERFAGAIANFLELPPAAVSVEDQLVIKGVCVGSIQVKRDVVGEAKSFWRQVSRLAGEKSRLRTSAGFSVTLVEVTPGISFSVSLDGDLTGFLDDEDIKRDVLEELEAQLKVPNLALDDFQPHDIRGEMTTRAYVSITKMVRRQIQDSDDAEKFTLPGISCSLKIEDGGAGDGSDSDDLSSNNSSVDIAYRSKSGPGPGRGLPLALSGISEVSSSGD